MSEEQVAVSSETKVAQKVVLVDLAFGALMVVICAWCFWKRPDSVLRLITVLGLVPPTLLFFARAWNRWFHRDLVPARWSKESRMGQHLSIALLVLSGVFVLLVCASIFLVKPGNHRSDEILRLLAYSAQWWTFYLMRYVADRSYIPPPAADPTGGWAGAIKGIYSEHWGGREMAEGGRVEA